MKAARAVVLLSLLVFCNVAYSALNCGVNGVQDSYATSYCSCFSGYAPSTKAQSDCDESVMCPAHVAKDDKINVGSYQPKLYNSSFKADHYNAVLRFPLVVGRRNATVRFAAGEGTCGYPGSLWVKKVNSLDCIDELYGSIPWASHEMCGFSKSIHGAKTTYSAVLMVTYDDLITPAGEPSFVRTMGLAMNVNVTFTTQTSVIFSLIDLNAANKLVEVVVIGNVIYDANTKQAAVTLRTKTAWPYKVAGISMFTTPYPNTAAISSDVFFDATSGCNNVTNSACGQQYIMRINPTTGCNLGGLYSFNITLNCRGLGPAVCSGTYNAAGSYSVRLYDTNICGVGGIDVSLANGVLLPFADAAGTTPAANFVPNQWVYFAFVISSDSVTIDDVIVEKIYAKSADVEDDFYDLHPVGVSGPMLIKGTAAELQITSAVTPVSPGVPATLWFRVKLIDAITSFRVLPSAAATVTMSIIVNLQYHGNQRRSVEATASVTSSQGAADIYISGTSATVEDALTANSAATTITPLFAVFYSVFAVVVAAFVMRR